MQPLLYCAAIIFGALGEGPRVGGGGGGKGRGGGGRQYGDGVLPSLSLRTTTDEAINHSKDFLAPSCQSNLHLGCRSQGLRTFRKLLLQCNPRPRCGYGVEWKPVQLGVKRLQLICVFISSGLLQLVPSGTSRATVCNAVPSTVCTWPTNSGRCTCKALDDSTRRVFRNCRLVLSSQGFGQGTLCPLRYVILNQLALHVCQMFHLICLDCEL